VGNINSETIVSSLNYSILFLENVKTPEQYFEKKFSVDRHEFEFGNLANLLKVLGSEIKKEK
jgi:hypothetical protein